MKLIFDVIKNGSDFPEKRKYIFNKSEISGDTTINNDRLTR